MRSYDDFFQEVRAINGIANPPPRWRIKLSGKSEGKYTLLKTYDDCYMPTEEELEEDAEGYVAYRVFLEVKEDGKRWSVKTTLQQKLMRKPPVTGDRAVAESVTALTALVQRLVGSVTEIVETQNKVISSLGTQLVDAQRVSAEAQNEYMALAMEIVTAEDNSGNGEQINKLVDLVGTALSSGVTIE